MLSAWKDIRYWSAFRRLYEEVFKGKSGQAGMKKSAKSTLMKKLKLTVNFVHNTACFKKGEKRLFMRARELFNSQLQKANIVLYLTLFITFPVVYRAGRKAKNLSSL